MKTIRLWTLQFGLILSLAVTCLSTAAFAGHDNCGCGAATCDACTDLTCAAPGCDQIACDAGVCDAVASACDAACDVPCGPTCNCLVCCNRFSVLAEAMFLRRSDAGSVPLILNQETGETILNANNLEFNHQAVPRLSAYYDHCCCWGLGVSFFGTDSWSTSESRGGDVSPILVGPGINLGSTAPGTVYQIGYSSDLYSGEVNLRRRCHECVTWIAGFRWIEFSDELTASATAPIAQQIYSVDADNHLYGFQIGADATLIQPSDRFRFDGIFRVGILGNNADQTTRAPLAGQFNGLVDQIGAKGDETSFMAELGLRAVLNLTSSLAVTGGYQALWLDGLALAPEQIPVTNIIAPGSAALNTNGDLLFHGFTAGVQWTY